MVTEIDISKALTIPGWMTPRELAWLAMQATQHERIVEIGSYQGRSTRALADNTPGTVYAVDLWALGPWVNEIDWMAAKFAECGPEFVYEAFQQNLSPHIETGKVVPIRSTSSDAAVDLHDQFFDMIFIDGAHDYDSVVRDIILWSPMATGLLCGHDYDHVAVQRAVKMLVPDHIVIEGTTLWMRNR